MTWKRGRLRYRQAAGCAGLLSPAVRAAWQSPRLGGCAASWQGDVRSGRYEASRFGVALRLPSCHRGEKESEGELGGIAEPREEVGELSQLSWWLLFGSKERVGKGERGGWAAAQPQGRCC